MGSKSKFIYKVGFFLFFNTLQIFSLKTLKVNSFRNCYSAANKYIDLPAKKKIIGPSLESFFKDQFYVIPLIIMISTGIVYGTIYQRCSDDCM